MTNVILSELLLEKEGYAVFENCEKGVLRRIGTLPQWFHEIFGAGANVETSAWLAERSPFLENFLVDADEFWNSNKEGTVNSGAWIERGLQGREFALEASATRLAGKKILVLANPEHHYQERAGTLQTARDFTLQHERLQKEIAKKEILLHCIIHDLSQPLTAIRGCLSLMGMEKLPESARPVLEVALNQTRHQEEMIRAILDAFSGELAAPKLGAGDADSGPDLARCAQEVAKDYAPAFAERGSRIEMDATVDLSGDWRVCGDAPRLRRIYSNLVENALRYSAAGSKVSLGIAEQDGCLLATVDDQGPGLPKGDAAPQLFALFGKSKQGGGKAGLGLYFCKMTVERWGGKIGAESRREGGARFWFRLPRWQQPKTASRVRLGEPPENAPGPDAKRDIGQAASPTRDTRPLRILLAEDLGVNRELMAKMLEKHGHTVVCAKNGREAVAAFGRETFDVVLMDLQMPEMNGIEATKIIRGKERTSGGHTRIVAMTAHESKGIRQHLLEVGMDAHIAKPFDMDRLIDILEGVVEPGDQKSETSLAAAAETGEGKNGFAEALLQRVGGDRKLLSGLTRLFRAEYPKKLKEAHQAIRKGDARALAGAAHAVNGLVGNFGAHEALAKAKSLEATGWNGDLTGASDTLAALEKDIAALEKNLDAVSAMARGTSAPKTPRRTPRERK